MNLLSSTCNLHGGPDFDHNYLVPDMARLSESFRSFTVMRGDAESPWLMCGPRRLDQETEETFTEDGILKARAKRSG